MPSILSQREIDALLSALPVEEAAPGAAADVTRVGKPVKTYDFRHPGKFSRDHLRVLEFIHENFSRRLQGALSAFLRTVVQINLLNQEEGVYDEYVRQVPSPAVLYPITMEPLPGRAILELHPSVVFIIVDRLLGGLGKGLAKSRELTDVEATLLEGIVWEVLSSLKEAWAQAATLQPRIGGEPASTAQFMQVSAGTDTGLIVSFEIRILDSAGTMRLWIPHLVLEPLLPELAQSLFASARKDLAPDQASSLRHNLERVRLPVVLELGETSLTIQEVLNLRAGDVIPIERRPNEELEVLVEGRPKYKARPGMLGHHLAMRITSVIPEDESADEFQEKHG